MPPAVPIVEKMRDQKGEDDDPPGLTQVERDALLDTVRAEITTETP